MIIQKRLRFVRLRSWLNRNSPCLLPDESLGHSTTQLYQSLETSSSRIELFALFCIPFFLFFSLPFYASVLRFCTIVHIRSTYTLHGIDEEVFLNTSGLPSPTRAFRMGLLVCLHGHALPTYLTIHDKSQRVYRRPGSIICTFIHSQPSLSLYRASQPKRRPR